MPVTFLPALVDYTSSTIPLPYTSSPLALLWSDTKLFLRYAYALPSIVIPLRRWGSGELDELYPSCANVYAISLHVVLIALQLIFLLSIPLCLFSPIPLGLFVFYIASFVSINYYLCLLLNGKRPALDSRIDVSQLLIDHEDEQWIFLNGVAVGQHWLQSNIDRLSITFGRKILGVLNPTKGIIFDALECLIQRDFSYNTMSIRNCYAKVKAALMDENLNKVVFILHSQGGIEGGLALDWLLADVPNGLLKKLEVYTFGCAANHFNNPVLSGIDKESILESLCSGDRNEMNERVICRIEHYANSGDFVSKWGVLNFAASEKHKDNRFAGRVFKREGSGHQMNQHYLDNMFPLETPRGPVREDNSFMDTMVDVDEETVVKRESTSVRMIEQRGHQHNLSMTPNNSAPHSSVGLNGTPVNRVTNTLPPTSGSTGYLRATKANVAKVQQKPVSELSRLWQYRNGGSPED